MSFLVVEVVLPPGNEPSPANALDLLMLLNHPGGDIRTQAEWDRLFAEAGLRLTTVIPTASPNRILESVHALPVLHAVHPYRPEMDRYGPLNLRDASVSARRAA